MSQDSRNPFHFWLILAISVCFLPCTSRPGLLTADGGDEIETHTFAGKWNNKKYGTSGPLRCVMTETAPGEWKAVFTGTFQNDPFKYDATFQAKKIKNQLNVGGTAKIRGHDYEWTGIIKNGRLTAQYKSSVGYFGGFVMQKVKK